MISPWGFCLLAGLALAGCGAQTRLPPVDESAPSSSEGEPQPEVSKPNQGPPADEPSGSQAASLRRECDDGDLSQCSQLALRYLSGAGVKKDAERAVHFFKRACDADVALDCARLGAIYHTGQGVPKSSMEASVYLGRACELGHHRACEILGRDAGTSQRNKPEATKCPSPAEAVAELAKDFVESSEDIEMTELGDLDGDGFVEHAGQYIDRAVSATWIVSRSQDACYRNIYPKLDGGVDSVASTRSNGWADLVLVVTLDSLAGMAETKHLRVLGRYDGHVYRLSEVLDCTKGGKKLGKAACQSLFNQRILSR